MLFNGIEDQMSPGCQVYIEKLNRSYFDRNEERENHVILITVINPSYPITTVSGNPFPYCTFSSILFQGRNSSDL